MPPAVVLMPPGVPVTEEQYLRACEHVSISPEGKVIVGYLRQQLYSALTNHCPETETQKRSEWLKAHDAVVSCRLAFLRHFTENINLLPDTSAPQSLRGVGGRG